MRSVRDRYNDDPEFHQLVKMMEALVHQGRFTPSEMREAAILASILYEELHLRDYTMLYVNREVEESLYTIRQWVDEKHDAAGRK